ncbi:dihydrolipoamide dehydrogenase [Trichlorobacter thiogenes]|uniref:Dihydrolipoyl dehydrogenase n=1 Tax=Trichlorobacter thiogenes TaxID=115783 RepID=A0A1T4QCT0_9BACT|nr:dihydrolipoyl dehydrogenase [Trichlorobacter thiogenes]SKA01331.1 dihydrolipoamide dehydrogenase [Trichlorobacter thiogenes]
MSEQFDLIVIGAGPGGYVAAIRASQLGMKVAVVEKRATLGGVCLNEGCIPSKALLDSSEHFALARDKFALHGIEIDPPRLNLAAMQARKDDVVKKLTDGVAYLFKKNKIILFTGSARLKGLDAEGMQQVAVEQIFQLSFPNGDQQPVEAPQLLRAAKVLLATGSEPIPLPNIPFDGELVVSAREALAFDQVPDHLVVAGGGYIGLELGSVWRRLGARVTVMEALPGIVPSSDRQVADYLQRTLKKQGIEFRLNTRVTGLRRLGAKAMIQFSSGDENSEIDCDRLLVAIGRRPLVTGLGAEDVGICFDQNGRMQVDENYQTTCPGIYAVGDLIPGPMLAHKASEEGVVCVERMHGKVVTVAYDCLPGVVYTWPEGASVGKTEDQLKEAAVPYKVGKFNFMGNGRARAMDETEGFVKVLAHAESDRLLGVHIVGPRASDMIAEAVTAIGFKGTARELGMQFHAHPTLSEALKEAALDIHKEAIHG